MTYNVFGGTLYLAPGAYLSIQPLNDKSTSARSRDRCSVARAMARANRPNA